MTVAVEGGRSDHHHHQHHQQQQQQLCVSYFIIQRPNRIEMRGEAGLQQQQQYTETPPRVMEREKRQPHDLVLVIDRSFLE